VAEPAVSGDVSVRVAIGRRCREGVENYKRCIYRFHQQASAESATFGKFLAKATATNELYEHPRCCASESRRAAAIKFGFKPVHTLGVRTSHLNFRFVFCDARPGAATHSLQCMQPRA